MIAPSTSQVPVPAHVLGPGSGAFVAVGEYRTVSSVCDVTPWLTPATPVWSTSSTPRYAAGVCGTVTDAP